MLWKWQTWKSAASFLFGKRGLLRRTYPAWRAYFRRDFHPSQQNSELSRRWLESHTDAFSLVGSR
jgi:predicted metal-dependent hydrolase